MKIDVVMPKMGESLQEGTIQKWMKSIGDNVDRDEMILEISTDKVDTEVPSPKSGKLVEILAQEGETVEVGSVIAIIETDSDAAEVAPAVVKSVEPVAEVATTTVPEVAPVAVEATTVPEVEPLAEVATAGDAVDVVMPKMGESLQEGTIQKWLKSVGDKIERDEMILEISTDKVDTEVPSPVAGILVEILAQEGETVDVGSVIARISQSGSAPKAAAAPASKPEAVAQTSAPAPAAPQQVTQSVSIPEGGTTEIPVRFDGKFFSPLVRNISESNGITLEELNQLNGSGIDGRVNKDDIMNYIANRSKPTVESKPAPTKVPAPEVKASAPAKSETLKSYPIPKEDVEILPMNRVRQLISEHMVYSVHTSPHVTTVAEVDVTDLVNFRNKHKKEFADREGFNLTFTPFFIKALIDGVRKFPLINVSVDGKNIIRHKRINMGVATALPNGNLIVPVIKKADELNITGIARKVSDLANRARSKQLQPDEIQGGTISITNFGSFGALFGTPIINQPQTAIIGVGAIKKQPAVVEVAGQDMILVRHIMVLSITFDHRVIDGMLGGQALEAMVKSLENMNANNIDL